MTSTNTPETTRTDSPAKLAGLVIGLLAVVCLMLLAFATPSLQSGAKDLPLAVSGPVAATQQLTATIEAKSPGTFSVTTYTTAEDGAAAITHRDAIGGIAVGADGVTIQTAAGAGSPYTQLLKGVGTQLLQGGQKVTFQELAPTTADDPSGLAIGVLGLPLVFGGLAASAALVVAYKGAARNRFVAAFALAILAGLATTAILQFGFGAFDGNYWLTSAAVATGILAISFPALGLEQRLGYAGLGIMGVLLIFLSNPLSGLATGPQWLPGWAAFGQLLPIGAAGSAIRSAVYFDGAGATLGWVVLACWALAGLAVGLIPSRRAKSA